MNTTISDHKYANIASQEAHKSKMTMHHGCIAVKGGKIIARGHNNYRTYSNDGMIKGCSCHAEIDVLRKCLKLGIINKINLYIVRVSPLNTFSDSTPCKECYTTMKTLFTIKYIVYTTTSGLIKKNFKDFISIHDTSGTKAIVEKRVKVL